MATQIAEVSLNPSFTTFKLPEAKITNYALIVL
jgi:hypothetical protein